jgi:hypothetical protein
MSDKSLNNKAPTQNLFAWDRLKKTGQDLRGDIT